MGSAGCHPKNIEVLSQTPREFLKKETITFRTELWLSFRTTTITFAMWAAVRCGMKARASLTPVSLLYKQRFTSSVPSRSFHVTRNPQLQSQLQPRITPPRYQRFNNNKIPFYQSKRFWVTTGTGTVIFGGYYVTHLETVPISGRTRFMDITPRQEEGNWS
jgi:hypothetical protein